MLVNLLVAVLFGVIAWAIAELVTDSQKARIIGIVVGVLTFLTGGLWPR